MPDDDLDRGLPNRFAGHVYGLALGLLFGAPLGWLLKVPGPWLVFFVFLFAWVLGTFMRHIVTGVVEGTAKFIISFLWPSGGATQAAGDGRSGMPFALTRALGNHRTEGAVHSYPD